MARARVDFELDQQGIAEILRSPQMRDAINGTAVQVAAAARSGLPAEADVEYRPYTTDRRAATVTVFGHGTDEQVQASALIRAARGIGLEVTERSDEQ